MGKWRTALEESYEKRQSKAEAEKHHRASPVEQSERNQGSPTPPSLDLNGIGPRSSSRYPGFRRGQWASAGHRPRISPRLGRGRGRGVSKRQAADRELSVVFQSVPLDAPEMSPTKKVRTRARYQKTPPPMSVISPLRGETEQAPIDERAATLNLRSTSMIAAGKPKRFRQGPAGSFQITPPIPETVRTANNSAEEESPPTPRITMPSPPPHHSLPSASLTVKRSTTITRRHPEVTEETIEEGCAEDEDEKAARVTKPSTDSVSLRRQRETPIRDRLVRNIEKLSGERSISLSDRTLPEPVSRSRLRRHVVEPVVEAPQANLNVRKPSPKRRQSRGVSQSTVIVLDDDNDNATKSKSLTSSENQKTASECDTTLFHKSLDLAAKIEIPKLLPVPKGIHSPRNPVRHESDGSNSFGQKLKLLKPGQESPIPFPSVSDRDNRASPFVLSASPEHVENAPVGALIEEDKGNLLDSLSDMFVTEFGFISLNYAGITNDTLRMLSLKFDALPKLQRLALSNNKVHCLPDEFMNSCKRAAVVNLAANSIKSLPVWFFSKCANLVQLDLSGNKLRNVAPNISDMDHLEVLDLGRNEITELPVGLGKLKRLRLLDLSYNELTSLPDDFGAENSALVALDISYNPYFSFGLPKNCANLCETIEDFFLAGTEVFGNLKRSQKKLPAPELVKFLVALTPTPDASTRSD